MIEFLTQPWSWWFSGILIVSIMFFLLYFGKSFGISANLRTICAASGVGKRVKFFDFNWRTQLWNLVFLAGSIIGGFISHQFMSNGEPVQLAEATIADLNALGFSNPTSIQPEELFSWEAIFTFKRLLHSCARWFTCRFWDSLRWRLHIRSCNKWISRFATSFTHCSNWIFHWRPHYDFWDFPPLILIIDCNIPI